MRRLIVVLLSILFATAAYLFVWPAANVPYFAAVILHLLAGITLLIFLAFALRGILRGASMTSRIGWILIAIGGVLGAVLVRTGTRRDEWPLLYTHIGACIAGGALLASAWAGKRGFLARRPATRLMRSASFLLLAGLLVFGARWIRNTSWERGHRIENPAMAPATMDSEGDGPSGPFFPSSAQTAHGAQIPANYFTESDSCQRCHADIYKEWQGSAHHFSSFNNAWYRKSIEYMQDTVGVKPSKWCAGCHDPALLYSGMFDRPIREVESTPAGQAGLGCMMCHSIARVKSTMGQGDFQLEYPALHRMAASTNPLVRRLHDFLTELNPEPHRRVFLKPFMRTQTAEFCSTCHKVHLDVPVNHYRWVRGFNEFDNWQASGVSGEGARSFYYPVKSQSCADCHMPMTHSADAGNIAGNVHSHRFPAANTALPYVNDDAQQLSDTENFLTDHEVSVDVFAISLETVAHGERAATEVPGANSVAPNLETTFAQGEEAETSVPANASPESATPIALLTAPLNRSAASVRQGGTYRVDVVVRTRKLGHFFPGGTVDAYDCWLELKAVDDKGETIFWSGRTENDGKGPVDPGAHFYRSLQIDAHGNPINKRNAWSTRATVYVRLIPPGAADTVHYRVQIPPHASGRIHLTARVNYRKFAWWNTQFAFAGDRDSKDEDIPRSPDFDDAHYVFNGDPAKLPGGGGGIPSLPIVAMAENTVDLKVLPGSAAEPEPKIVLNRDDWTRWNDYGIGLFLQGDLTGASGAFEKLTQIVPDNPDGWVNVGRVRVQEGNLAAAREALEHALSLNPHLARAQFFYAKMLRNEGHYDQAAEHLRGVLAQYPRDRVARDELGRIYFLQRRYVDAVKEFDATLAIDPEDLEANYNLMLCNTGLGRPGIASEFQKRYLRFKADESAQTLTGPYLRAHLEDNVERQPIHEHVSASAAKHKSTAGKYESPSGRAKDSD
ncbi:MAG TPA: tetratricopeptide repeat protein [Candidatus Acidoferrales bacterium]|nr:tetratricopeptide repeat protein [Candidatus Acidoferrales bacterium]